MKSTTTRLRNWRFRVRQFTARYPWMFYTLYQLSPVNRKLMVTAKTRITIEGYPRSANTYAVYAFKHVNPLQWDEIGHHLHVQAQIIRSIQYKIPVILLIRHPLEAVRSLVVRHDFIEVDEALADYCRFYSDLYPLREGYVVADFERVISDFGGIIEILNRKLSSSFNLFPAKDAENYAAMNAAVMDEIDRYNKMQEKGRLTHLHRPDEDKERLKSKVEINHQGELYKQAVDIYHKFKKISC